MGTQSPGTQRKTDILLAGALLRLLEKKSFKRISVNDICQEAMVSRSAFYQHFADKYALLSYCADKELSLLGEQSKRLSMEQTIENLLAGIQAKQKLLYNMFRAELNRELMDIFLGAFQRYIQKELEYMQSRGVQLSAPIPMLTAFLSGGLANTVIQWIQEAYATPCKELARQQCALMVKAMGVSSEELAILPGDKPRAGAVETNI